MSAFDDTTLRLRARKQILDLIDRLRKEECDTGIGASIEACILTQEMASLEADTGQETRATAERRVFKPRSTSRR